MLGILCEKPSQARNFAKALGGMSGTFDNEPYMITCARGHLYEFKEPHEQVAAGLSARYKSWSLANLPWDETAFNWSHNMKKDASGTLKQIKDVLSKCDTIAIATDIDPSGEGDLLAWEVLDGLKLTGKPVCRFYFTDEAVASIQKAFKGRKMLPPMQQDPSFRKAFYRQRWDFMSQQFTRIATTHGDGKSVLRQGRLKSAMVLLVGDQLVAVAAYKKIPFYQNRFRDENGVVYTNPDEPIFPDKKQVPQTYHASAVIVDYVSMKSTAPPKFMDLASLSAMLANKGYKAKTVLDVYQKMYENQVVSYPRTEDKVVTPEQFKDLLPHVDKIAHVIGVDPGILTHRAPRGTHVKAGGAHGANRPGPNVPNNLSDLAQYGACAPEIYEILARSYLACMAEDYEYEAQNGHVKDYPDFKGTASVPKVQGWKVLFGGQDADDDDGDVNAKGLGSQADPFIHEGFPPKPANPTMKWLMKQLEKYDVGTGATRTSTYAEVTNEKAKYPLLVDKKGRITMADCGEMSYRLLPGTHIGDLKITEQVQAQMKDIAAGKANPDDCLHEIQRMVLEDIETMKKNGMAMRKEMGITMADNSQKEKYTGTWNGEEVSFNRVWAGHRFTDKECEDLCAGLEIEVKGLKSAKGSTYGVRGRLSNQVYNNKPFVGFERTSFLSSDKVPDSWCQHTFTPEERALLESGKPVKIDGCISKKGNVFGCTVTFGKNEKGQMGIIPDFNK